MKSVLVLSFMIFGSAFADSALIEKGRHIILIGACNDCHTAEFGPKNGNVPEKDWLTGSPVGFKGPWGVSYPSNLRNLVATFKEKPFINHVRTKKYLPPMPGGAMMAMTDEELSAVYAYLKHLGPAGKKAPTNLPPGAKIQGPYFNFVPVVD